MTFELFWLLSYFDFWAILTFELFWLLSYSDFWANLIFELFWFLSYSDFWVIDHKIIRVFFVHFVIVVNYDHNDVFRVVEHITIIVNVFITINIRNSNSIDINFFVNYINYELFRNYFDDWKSIIWLLFSHVILIFALMKTINFAYDFASFTKDKNFFTTIRYQIMFSYFNLNFFFHVVQLQFNFIIIFLSRFLNCIKYSSASKDFSLLSISTMN